MKREVYRRRALRPPQARNLTGFKGVFADKRWPGRFRAQSQFGYAIQDLGRYDDVHAAAVAYDLAALRYFGRGRCYTNFPLAAYPRGCEDVGVKVIG